MVDQRGRTASILMYTDEDTGGLAAAGAEGAQLVDKFGSKGKSRFIPWYERNKIQGSSTARRTVMLSAASVEMTFQRWIQGIWMAWPTRSRTGAGPIVVGGEVAELLEGGGGDALVGGGGAGDGGAGGGGGDAGADEVGGEGGEVAAGHVED